MPARIFAASMLLMLATVAQAAETTTEVKADLVCGDAVLAIQTTFLVDPDRFTQVLAQRVMWKNMKTNQEKEIPIDGKYVTRHIPEARKILDAWISGWYCVKAVNGRYYFGLSYMCADGEYEGICARETVQVEWSRYMDDQGVVLFKSPRHWKMKRAEEAAYRRLGFFDPKRVVSGKSITSSGSSDE